MCVFIHAISVSSDLLGLDLILKAKDTTANNAEKKFSL